MKKNVAVRVLCLIIAGVVLGSAVTVAAFMGSPYEVLKKAVLDAVTYRNATVNGQITVIFDGEIVGERKLYYVEGDDAFLSYNFDEKGDIEGYHYSTKGLSISGGYYFNVVGFPWHSANIFAKDGYSNERGEFSLLSPDERYSLRIRFMELLFDALVGDLKNNITMSSENGLRIISGTLTENQIPELVKAYLDMHIEGLNNGADFENEELQALLPEEVPLKSLVINYIHGEVKVDAAGNLLSINADGRYTTTNILGNREVIEVIVTIDFSDIGTSNPSCPIPGARQLLTPEYVKSRFGSESVLVNFTQNEDGSINEMSITTTYPRGLGSHYEIKVEGGVFLVLTEDDEVITDED